MQKVFVQQNRFTDAAQRFQYALKQLANATGCHGNKNYDRVKGEWRDIKVTLLLNLAQCLRKLRVSG